jgi:hypothetical protein
MGSADPYTISRDSGAMGRGGVNAPVLASLGAVLGGIALGVAFV